jgi:hypothetical protein
MKRLIIGVMMLVLTACAAVPAGVEKPPAPLQQTVIDEKGLIAAFSAFDLTLTAVDGLVATGVIVAGSPRAIEIKGYLQRAKDGLNAADAARKAGSSSNYVAALENARTALLLLGKAFKKGDVR